MIPETIMYCTQSGAKRDSASADLSVRMHPSLTINKNLSLRYAQTLLHSFYIL
jgi:hypothetical protein